MTVTEYGDLVCPICQEFAFGSEQQLIKNEVRSGKVKLVYRGVETASSQANGGEYVASQVAARAAGQQHRAWQYIMLWYYEQGDETTPYVTNAFMQNIAAAGAPDSTLTKWQTDPATDAALTADVDRRRTGGAAGRGPGRPARPINAVDHLRWTEGLRPADRRARVLRAAPIRDPADQLTR